MNENSFALINPKVEKLNSLVKDKDDARILNAHCRKVSSQNFVQQFSPIICQPHQERISKHRERTEIYALRHRQNGSLNCERYFPQLNSTLLISE